MDCKKSADEIQKELLENISDSYEKRKGYFLWDILKAIAIGMKSLLNLLYESNKRLNVENLHEKELEDFIYQRTGIERKKATFAKGILTVKGNGMVMKGDLFETSGLIRYEAIETIKIIESGKVKIQAVNAGSSGNIIAGMVTKIPITIQGISSCVNEEAIKEGYEEESDEDLLNRYYEKLRKPITSGNIYHYLQWAKEVAGVGAAKVIPLWKGNNTVRILIINQKRQPASLELVKTVQDYIDPGSRGTGEGTAPIGAFCTVDSAVKKEVIVSVKIFLKNDYTVEIIKENIERSLVEYFAEIAFEQNYASFAKIGSIILDCEGVLDYENLKLNGLAQNMTCEDIEVMVLGGVNLL